MNDETPGRGVSGLETPLEGHPGPANERVGICGTGAPHVLIKGSGSLICDLPAGHAGWHRAEQIGSTPMHWGQRGDDWTQTLFDQRDAALDAVARVRALHTPGRDGRFGEFCLCCRQSWPCRTTRALEGP